MSDSLSQRMSTIRNTETKFLNILETSIGPIMSNSTEGIPERSYVELYGINRGISSNTSNLDWWDYKVPTDKEYKELINRLKQKVYKQRPGVYRIV